MAKIDIATFAGADRPGRMTRYGWRCGAKPDETYPFGDLKPLRNTTWRTQPGFQTAFQLKFARSALRAGKALAIPQSDHPERHLDKARKRQAYQGWRFRSFKDTEKGVMIIWRDR